MTQPNPLAVPAPATVAGPRPLPLHLALQTLLWLSSRAALPSLSNGSLTWRPEVATAAQALTNDLAGVDPEAFARALDAEALRRTGAFADGVVRYRRFPRPERPPEPPVVWRQGTTRVLDYTTVGHRRHRAGGGRPVLVVPSLINRAYILDLSSKRSLMRHLAAAGFRPYLVDWGAPGEAEMDLTLTDYIAGRLAGALDSVVGASGRPAAVIGYCMGGLLALALAARRPDDVDALALLATPWNFHAAHAAQRRVLQAMAPTLSGMIDALGFLPVDVLQAMFTSLSPYQTATKFRRFAALADDGEPARHFVELEDWLNDGVPLVGRVARECLFGWYVDNTPGRGLWTVAGRPVSPGEIAVPALVVIPEKDHIVPPGSAAALARALPHPTSWRLAAGHIGMAAGTQAKSQLFDPLAAWLAAV
jgi:polyhydroxyalkanoate synthase